MLRTLLPLFLVALPLLPQAMRTRDITRMNQYEVAGYLKNNDVLFVPVGSVEGNNLWPADIDYAAALAVAMDMAETGNGLYAPNLAYFYAGSTITSEATVSVSLSQSREYLKALAKSFLRQGFKTQVWIVSGHGPAPLFVGSMVREFFDETHVPILTVDAMQIARKQGRERSKIIFGTYSKLKRIDDLPLEGAATPKRTSAPPPPNEGAATLSKLGYGGSLNLGIWHADPLAHGEGGNGTLPKSATERAERGREGEREISAMVKAMNVPAMLKALKSHAAYTEEHVVKPFRAMLP